MKMMNVLMPKIKLQNRWIGFICLAVTACGWALNFTAIKILLHEWPPLFSRGVAGVAASILLAALAFCLGEKLTVPKKVLPRLLFASFTNVFSWMGFGTLALKWLDVGESLLLIYTMPIWSTIFAWPILGIRPTSRSIFSLLLGSAGVVVLLSGQEAAFGAGQLWGVLFSLGAAVLFALGAVLNRSPLPIPFVVSTAWQVGLGCVPLALLGLAFEHPHFSALTSAGAWIMIYMALVAMGVCYLTWFATLRFLPATTAATGMLSVPVFGVLSAAIMLGESFGIREVMALALTLSGVALALRS